eukprot:gb/GECG01014553.1/.p1 GENE.gb/GECG01014553.1/~~gb/GECG01014553.1/.p1  ORF type:complete len:123 (+),score=4.79 gb/GECG01014553.1/:1-369(+)
MRDMLAGQRRGARASKGSLWIHSRSECLGVIQLKRGSGKEKWVEAKRDKNTCDPPGSNSQARQRLYSTCTAFRSTQTFARETGLLMMRTWLFQYNTSRTSLFQHPVVLATAVGLNPRGSQCE